MIFFCWGGGRGRGLFWGRGGEELYSGGGGRGGGWVGSGNTSIWLCIIYIWLLFRPPVIGRMEDVIMIYPEGMTDFYYPNGTQERGLQGWNAQGSAENTATGCYLGYHQCGYDICQVCLNDR